MNARVEGIEYELKLPGAGSDIYVQGVVLKDRLNAPYSLTIECFLPQLRGKPIQAVCEKLIGLDATLILRRTLLSVVQEQVHGVVTGVARAASSFDVDLRRERGEVGGVEESQDYMFVVHVAPALELLRTQTAGNGSWHERTYPEVLTKVLTEALAPYGRQISDKTTQTNKIDNIVRPPGESLLDFVMRLMQVAGITSYFAHDSATETLVLCDTNDGFIEGTQYQPRDQPFRVDYTQRHNVSENVEAVQAGAQMQPARYEIESFDGVGTPPVAIVGVAEGDGPPSSTVREWGLLRPTEIGDADEQHERAAKLRLDEAQTANNQVTARTTILGMLAGRTFELELKPGDVRTHVVTSVTGSGTNAQHTSGEDYSNEVVFAPLTTTAGTAINVRSTAPVAEQRMPGLTLAQIVAIENAPVEVDRLLRCRLKFLWDQQEGESPTTYVSVLQNMAGLFGGTQWIPREGDRVVVAFHEGRPDRGVVLGAIYDEQYKPPYMGPPDRSSVLPESAQWLGWNHASIEPGTRPADQSCLDRHTMLCMDVTANSELFYFGAPKDWRRDVGNDSLAKITGNETIEIGKSLQETVGQSATQKVGTDFKQDVGASHATKVGSNHSLDVTGTSTVKVTGKRQERFGSYSMSVESGSSMSLEPSKRIDRTMGDWAGTATSSIHFQAPSVSVSSGGGGGMGAAAGAALSLKSKASLAGPGGAELSSSGSTVVAEASGVASRGPAITNEDTAGAKSTLQDGSYVVDAPRGVTLRCGASELRLTPEGMFLNGHRVNISATSTEIETDRLDISGD